MLAAPGVGLIYVLPVVAMAIIAILLALSKLSEATNTWLVSGTTLLYAVWAYVLGIFPATLMSLETARIVVMFIVLWFGAAALYDFVKRRIDPEATVGGN